MSFLKVSDDLAINATWIKSIYCDSDQCQIVIFPNPTRVSPDIQIVYKKDNPNEYGKIVEWLKQDGLFLKLN